jgi:hypothetical protein
MDIGVGAGDSIGTLWLGVRVDDSKVHPDLERTKAKITALHDTIKKRVTQLEQAHEKSLKDVVFFTGKIMAAWMMVGTAMAAVGYAVKRMTTDALQYLGRIEGAALGIASAFMTGGKYVDTLTGKVLQGNEALAAGMTDATNVIKELRVANLQTIATLDQLITAYQTTVPVALTKGFNKNQILDFTVAVVQAAGAIGISLDMLAEETRSLLTGTISPRTSRIAVVLGLTNEDIREHSQNAETLFNFLMGKLAAYRSAGIEAQKTWLGLWSNIQDLINEVGGMLMKPAFVGIKSLVSDIAEYFVHINNETKKLEWNPDFIASLNKANMYFEELGPTIKQLLADLAFIFKETGPAIIIILKAIAVLLKQATNELTLFIEGWKKLKEITGHEKIFEFISKIFDIAIKKETISGIELMSSAVSDIDKQYQESGRSWVDILKEVGNKWKDNTRDGLFFVDVIKTVTKGMEGETPKWIEWLDKLNEKWKELIKSLGNYFDTLLNRMKEGYNEFNRIAQGIKPEKEEIKPVSAIPGVGLMEKGYEIKGFEKPEVKGVLPTAEVGLAVVEKTGVEWVANEVKKKEEELKGKGLNLLKRMREEIEKMQWKGSEELLEIAQKAKEALEEGVPKAVVEKWKALKVEKYWTEYYRQQEESHLKILDLIDERKEKEIEAAGSIAEKQLEFLKISDEYAVSVEHEFDIRKKTEMSILDLQGEQVQRKIDFIDKQLLSGELNAKEALKYMQEKQTLLEQLTTLESQKKIKEEMLDIEKQLAIAQETQRLRDEVGFYSKEKYAIEERKLIDEKNAMILRGVATEEEANKWLYDRLKNLSIEYLDFKITNAKTWEDWWQAYWERALISEKNYMEKMRDLWDDTWGAVKETMEQVFFDFFTAAPMDMKEYIRQFGQNIARIAAKALSEEFEELMKGVMKKIFRAIAGEGEGETVGISNVFTKMFGGLGSLVGGGAGSNEIKEAANQAERILSGWEGLKGGWEGIAEMSASLISEAAEVLEDSGSIITGEMTDWAGELRETVSGWTFDLGTLWEKGTKGLGDLWDIICRGLSSMMSSLSSGGGGGMFSSLFSGLGSLVGGAGSAVAIPSWLSGSAGWGSSLMGIGLVGGLMHKGGIVGKETTLNRVMSLSSFVGAPKLHSGFAPDEFPAILQKGEMVIPRDIAKNALPYKAETKKSNIISASDQRGKDEVQAMVFNLNINATDARSFHDLCKRNPEALTEPIENAIRGSKSLRHTIRTLAR